MKNTVQIDCPTEVFVQDMQRQGIFYHQELLKKLAKTVNEIL